jgi:predicted nuclease of predicted toxin-antitoxin system
MAETFKSITLDAGLTMSDLISTVGANTQVIVLTCRATNVDGAADATVDVEITDGASKNGYIAYTMTVPADSSLELAGTSKLVLETGDKLQGLASATGDIEFFVSYLEIT